MFANLCPFSANSEQKWGIFIHHFDEIATWLHSLLFLFITYMMMDKHCTNFAFTQISTISQGRFNSSTIIQMDKQQCHSNNCWTLSIFVIVLLITVLPQWCSSFKAFITLTKAFEPLKYCLIRNSFISYTFQSISWVSVTLLPNLKHIFISVT